MRTRSASASDCLMDTCFSRSAWAMAVSFSVAAFFLSCSATCLLSTAEMNSSEKSKSMMLKSVIEMPIWESFASSSSRILSEDSARLEISSSAVYCAQTDLSTSCVAGTIRLSSYAVPVVL